MIIAFGYKRHSVPAQASKVFDVRALTHDTNRDDFLAKQGEIEDYVRQNPHTVIAIGCEQGKHRSVTLAKRIAQSTRTSYTTR
jgi:RNase adaptor protein for sRNA GlmZ degradation